MVKLRLHLQLIRLIGVIVPQRLRADWRQEWEAELRYREHLLADWDLLDWRHKIDLLWRSTSAFWDALWLQPQRLEDKMLQDLRFSLRMLLKNPGFSLLAILMLALGIGANTALFSVVNAVVLQPLPFGEPERLVWIWGAFQQGDRASVSPPDFLDYRAQNRSFEEFAAMRFASFNLTGTSEPERLQGARVTPNFFRTLGVQPILGRDFLPEEEEAGRDVNVIVSEGVWRRHFGSNPEILGQTMQLDGKSYSIVGVVPNRSRMPEQAEIWMPFTFDDPGMKVRRFHFLRPIARLKTGVTIEQAQADMDSIAQGLEVLYPDSNTTWRTRLVALPEQLLGDTGRALYLLLGAVALVLLIGCANVANLLLSRAVARQKEIALRIALGASRWRLVQQLMAESLIFALLGGISGLILANWGTKALVALAPQLPRAGEVGLDGTVLAFSFVISMLTALIFGLVPAIHASRPNLTDALKEGGRGSGTGARQNRVRNVLVVSEVALALMLLIGAGLLLQSFRRLQAVDPGFSPRNLLTFSTFLPQSKYAGEVQVGAFFGDVMERIRSLPGVQGVGLTTHLPMRGGGDTYFKIEGRPFPDPQQKVTAINPRVSHDYFRTMRIPLLKGRYFTEKETLEPLKTVIINESFERTYFENEEAVGRRLIIDMGESYTCEIVGVASDTRQYGLDNPLVPAMYLPSIRLFFGSIVVRTEGDPLNIAADVRNVVSEVDKDQPIANLLSMEQILADRVAEPRFRTVLLATFAVLALLLASAGIYGVMSYNVNRRTHEIGVRMALGARGGDVVRLVIRQGMIPVLIGLFLGLTASLILTQVMETLLFDVSSTDPTIFTGTAVLLALVALVACYAPARRSSRVDPMVALRDQ
jgi:putative ABC transport system permease protein